ncbi:MAG: tRNA (adenine(22)-N(1))-methyltransferase TrmK [Granulosicoccaceae bacterium]
MLSRRLRAIADLIPDDYSDIWDCCCDHGQLGFELLQRTSAVVHFVDREKSLIDAIRGKLEQGLAAPERWRVHCGDVCRIQLEQQPKPLIIIAGVGGNSCIAMVRSLLLRHPQIDADFLLCPVRQLEWLRASLSGEGLSLVQDYLLEDRARFYEILWIRRGTERPLGSIAQDVWLPFGALQNRYLHSRIKYFQHPSIAACPKNAGALASYLALRELHSHNCSQT